VTEVLVHGIADDAQRAEVAEPHVRWLTHGGLAALVGTVDPSGMRAASTLRLHWQVLEEAAKSATILPVRFGTIMASEDAVVNELLAPRQHELLSLLSDLANKVQMTVKGDFDEERLMRAVVESSPAIARLRKRVSGVPAAAAYYDRIRLGEMVAASVESAREQFAARVAERLEPLATATKVEPISSMNAAVNAAFLVEHDKQPEFRAAVTELERESTGAVRLRCIGPLPPYSFADIRFEPRSASWV
jgi:hypothetical protein